MKNMTWWARSMIIVFVNVLLTGLWMTSGFALSHTQREGLFKMEVPEGWRWIDLPQETLITFTDGKTMAIDIQFEPNNILKPADVKKIIKEGNDKLIKEGVLAHHGTLIDNKEIKVDGVYATQVDFNTGQPNNVAVTYISFFNNGYVYTITYGSSDKKMVLLMDDAVATFKFK